MRLILLLLSGALFAQDTTAVIEQEEGSEKAEQLLEERTGAGPPPVTQQEETPRSLQTPRPGNRLDPGPILRETTPAASPPAQVQEPPPEVATDEIIFRRDHTIPAGMVAGENMRIIGGDLTVNGTVKGKITLIGGNAYLSSGAVIDGQIIVIGGVVQKEDGVTINGKIIESNLAQGLIYRETDREANIQGSTDFGLDRRSDRARRSWIHPEESIFIYNRNEGLLFTPFNRRWDRRALSNFRLSWSLGVRLNRGITPALVGRATLEKGFFNNRNLSLYASGFRESRSDDTYRLPRSENSWAAFLSRQDFYDRWDETGWEVGLGLDFTLVKLKLGLVAARQDSLPLVNLWSLFDKERILRTNLSIPARNLGYYHLTLAFRTPAYHPLANGLALLLQAELYQGPRDSAGVLNMDRDQLIRRNLGMAILNWEFSPGLVFRTRLMAGSSQNGLEPHRYFAVGGLGSVNAHPYKVQRGELLAQANLELILTPEFTDSGWIVILFADAGNAWMKADYRFEYDRMVENGISAAGIGIGRGEAYQAFNISDKDYLNWSLNIAKPLDRRDQYQTTLRINLNF